MMRLTSCEISVPFNGGIEGIRLYPFPYVAEHFRWDHVYRILLATSVRFMKGYVAAMEADSIEAPGK